MRAVALLAVGLSSLLMAGSIAFGMSSTREHQRRSDQRLSATAGDEASRLEAYFQRSRSVMLLTAQNPAFRAFYTDPGQRVDKVRARTRSIREAEDGLAYLERLYSGSIGEACFIDRSGPENARFTDGVRAPLEDLSQDESKAPFYAPTFALPPGQVYQAKPYISPDTKTWVISNSTPLPGTGRPARAIIHFEVSLASFQREAAAIARGSDVSIVDSDTGAVVIDSQKPLKLSDPVGQPRSTGSVPLAGGPGLAQGTTTIAGHRAAFRRLSSTPHNANRWTVVVAAPRPAPSFLSTAGWASLAMAVAGLALLIVGILGFRSSRRSIAVQADLQTTEQERIKAERIYHDNQREFTEVMQITRDESEAYGLLTRHLERSLEGSQVLVLNRNNSHDRLEPMATIDEGSPLHDVLKTARPDSCLAVRLGKMYERTDSEEPLLTCDVCGWTEGNSTCMPSLVGGEVIGSVLVRHPGSLEPVDRRCVEESMTQASPVLANLRNLALSQARALTDGLTGLPNRRAIEDMLKRMVAHTDRSGGSLAVILFDLDHFKQINDLYGHEKGDEVLSSVGVTIANTIRSSDFAGRHGGEEFILLLPDANAERAIVAAEKLRRAIAAIEVPGVPRAVTASFGIATMPADGFEPSSLLRTADRALYLAKANGRNRVETLAPNDPAPAAASGDAPRSRPAH
jgi:diguanylate cyclase (GGDEF)-like protein